MSYLLKNALICVPFCISIAMALEPAEIAEARQLQNEYLSSGRQKDNVRKLSAQQRTLLAAYYREMIVEAEIDKDDHWRRHWISELALLGDDWARNEAVKMFWENSRTNGSSLEYLSDPKILSVIGEGLFMEEEVYGIGDVYFGTTQRGIAGVFIATLANSPEFSADVINWARRLGGPPDINMMRDWYRANEAKLKAGDFKAVQPGAEPPARTASAADGGPSSTVADASQPGSTPASSPGISKTPESSGNLYAWIAALLIAICGGLVWLLKSQRS